MARAFSKSLETGFRLIRVKPGRVATALWGKVHESDGGDDGIAASLPSSEEEEPEGERPWTWYALDMLIHILALHWKPEATQAQKEQAVIDIKAISSSVPGISELHVGPNIAVRSQAYELVVFIRFETLADFENFSVHPSHNAFIRSYAPVLDIVVLDLEV